MTTAIAVDPRKFRDALGSFTTGVTIITTRRGDGTPVGITANSFNSVSLDPPMVLWSLAKTSRCLEVFNQASYWAVHILSAGQETLSNRFAKSGEDKFNGVETVSGIGNIPLLNGCSARLQCKATFQYEGGDHIIFVGEVMDFERSELPPLVFQAGKYAVATRKTDSVVSGRPPTVQRKAGWREDHLAYLLGRAYFQIYAQIHRQARRHGLNDIEYFTLATLILRNGSTLDMLNEVFSYSGHSATRDILQKLADRGWLYVLEQGNTETFHLTSQGRLLTLRVIAASEAIEADVLAAFGDWEALSLKNLLRQLIQLTDPGLPDLWAAAPDSNVAPASTAATGS